MRASIPQLLGLGMEGGLRCLCVSLPSSCCSFHVSTPGGFCGFEVFTPGGFCNLEVLAHLGRFRPTLRYRLLALDLRCAAHLQLPASRLQALARPRKLQLLSREVLLLCVDILHIICQLRPRRLLQMRQGQCQPADLIVQTLNLLHPLAQERLGLGQALGFITLLQPRGLHLFFLQVPQAAHLLLLAFLEVRGLFLRRHQSYDRGVQGLALQCQLSAGLVELVSLRHQLLGLPQGRRAR
mmetsp:Transcript_134963/g.288742  ORF Transcript_134963/g.288742 Transcript_134963/m.288742 type:complete len:239 (-) Transcript_134963:810-1526(-)